MAAKLQRLYTQDDKEKQISRELTRLRKVYANMGDDQKRVAEGLIKEAAFMRVTLEETRDIIDREGVVELFEQGAQKFVREHPATKVYASFINRYSAVIKQLVDLLPKGEKDKVDTDELMEFVKSQAR